MAWRAFPVRRLSNDRRPWSASGVRVDLLHTNPFSSLIRSLVPVTLVGRDASGQVVAEEEVR
jgi:hypothetical protein